MEDYNGFTNSSVVIDPIEIDTTTPRDNNGDTLVSNFDDNIAHNNRSLNIAKLGSEASPMKSIKFKS